ncbi:MAG: hypothetical protein V1738_04590 [Patescibacteria group bacterium]
MTTAAIVLLAIVGVAAYIYIGVQLARVTVRLIRSGDRQSWTAFLMMPMRCYREDGERLQRLTEHDRQALLLIVAFNVLLWPLKVLWNIPGWVVFGPIILVRRFL